MICLVQCRGILSIRYTSASFYYKEKMFYTFNIYVKSGNAKNNANCLGVVFLKKNF